MLGEMLDEMLERLTRAKLLRRYVNVRLQQLNHSSVKALDWQLLQQGKNSDRKSDN